MSTRALAYVATLTSVLTESEVAVAQALATLAREDDDIAQVTVAQIGAVAHRSPRCVQYCLRQLERLGYLHREHYLFGKAHPAPQYSFPLLYERMTKAGANTAKVRSFARAAEQKAAALRARHLRQLHDMARAHRPQDAVYQATLQELITRESHG